MRYWPFVVSVFVSLLAWAFARFLHASPATLTIIGGAFQVGGLAIVIFLLAKARNLFNLDSWWRKICRFLRRFVPRFLRRKGEPVTISGKIASLGTMTANATVEVGLPPNPTLEDRVSRLERRTDQIKARQQALKKRFTEQMTTLRGKLSEERKARIEKDRDLEKKIQDVAIGDESLHLAGATLFLAGIIFQTWAALASLAA